MEKLYGVTLSVPSFTDLGQLKQFTSGLVEGDGSHPWRDVYRSLGVRSRFGFAHSLFLFRKVIPQSKPQVKGYVEKMALAQAPPDPDFVSFALKTVRQLFRFGWDRSYQDFCLTSSLPMSACSEVGRKGGGCRGLEAMDRMNRAEFLTYVLQSKSAWQRGVSRVTAVETGGKWRVISIPPRVDNALRPLHKTMYSHLSRYSWLLRGDAKPGRFKDFVPVDGEVFVSGDYESATDNLNSDLQCMIMRELLERATTIPQGIRDHALQIYRSVLEVDGATWVQARGQLMGQLTSFPLLCLVNYITFRYSIRRDVPVRINGDDIVFRATPDEVRLWERNVAKGGLKLSKGKTLVLRRGFTLNSTPFWASVGGAVSIGFVRSSAIWKSADLGEQILSLNSRFYSSHSGFGCERRDEVRRFFVTENSKPIFASRRSLTRGIGLAVGQEILRSTGLWYRELYYLEQAVEQPLPHFAKGELPAGWRQVSKLWIPKDMLPSLQIRWSAECVSHAWTSTFDPSSFSSEEVLRRIWEGCIPYGLGSLIRSRVRRMLGMTRSEVWRWVNLRRNESVFGRVQARKGARVFVPGDLQFSSLQIHFVLGNA